MLLVCAEALRPQAGRARRNRPGCPASVVAVGRIIFGTSRSPLGSSWVRRRWSLFLGNGRLIQWYLGLVSIKTMLQLLQKSMHKPERSR